MRVIKSICGFAGVLSLVLTVGVTASAQDAPEVGPKPRVVVKPMESHIGNVTGHAADGKSNYRRYCAGCHGDYGDANGENAVWIDPKPRDFTKAVFKCRSTASGSLPLDSDLYDTITRGIHASGMPSWKPLLRQERADLVAYIKTFSSAFQEEKPGEPVPIPAEPTSSPESVKRGAELFQSMNCWSCHGKDGRHRRRSARDAD